MTLTCIFGRRSDKRACIRDRARTSCFLFVGVEFYDPKPKNPSI